MMKHGTPEMAAHLMSLWMPRDHPCVLAVRAATPLDKLPVLGQLTDEGMRCQHCGQDFVHVGADWFHPDSPALKWALDNAK